MCSGEVWLILGLLLNALLGAGFGAAAGGMQWWVYRERNTKANWLVLSNALGGAAAGFALIPTTFLIQILLNWIGQPTIPVAISLLGLACVILGSIYGGISAITSSAWVTSNLFSSRRWH